MPELFGRSGTGLPTVGAKIIIGYFTVCSLVRFLFTSCVKQTNERSE